MFEDEDDYFNDSFPPLYTVRFPELYFYDDAKPNNSQSEQRTESPKPQTQPQTQPQPQPQPQPQTESQPKSQPQSQPQPEPDHKFEYSEAIISEYDGRGFQRVKREIKDGRNGKTTTVETRRIGDQSMTLHRETDKDGKVTQRESRTNINEDQIESFQQRWNEFHNKSTTKVPESIKHSESPKDQPKDQPPQEPPKEQPQPQPPQPSPAQ
jgi:hypothetical protein